LADDCASSIPTVARKLDLLEESGLIARRKRYDNSDLIFVNVPLIRATILDQKLKKIREESSPFTETAETAYQSIAAVAAHLAEEVRFRRGKK
jgi:hypothetical protein